MRAAVIVQARATSTRLPGKVLLPLGNISIIEHVLMRCLAIANADVVCCAVPDTEDSTEIIKKAERMGAAVFKGSEDDVLQRHYDAAKSVCADYILRVTSDCPMTDPEVCADVFALVLSGTVDFACNNMPPSWPHGLDCEAVTMEWLERASKDANENYQREHVMPWIREHRSAKKVNLIGPGNGAENHRWTIDNERDYKFLRAIWSRLPDGPEGWSYRVALEIAEANPELVAINKGQDRRGGLHHSMRESRS